MRLDAAAWTRHISEVMKVLRFLVLAFAMTLPAAMVGWRKVSVLTAENKRLQGELQSVKAVASGVADAALKQRDAELQRLRAEAQDVVRLRNQVMRLSAGTKDSEKLRSEIQRLREENQHMRASTRTPANVVPTPALAMPPEAAAPKDSVPRESWTFAGYASPDALCHLGDA